MPERGVAVCTRQGVGEVVSGKVLRAVELACWCAGIALVALYFALRGDGEAERRAAITTFMAVAATAPLTYGAPDRAHWSQGRIRAYAAARAGAGLPVAVLRIRRIGLEVPVYAADTARNMNRGAVLVAGTAAPDSGGNTAIAAHRDGYFRALKNVVVGDVVSVQTLSRVERYRVTSLAIVAPTDVAVLRRTAVPAVTLVTCYPFYFVGSAPRRYIVRAVALDGAGRGPSARATPAAAHRRAPGFVHAPSALPHFETGASRRAHPMPPQDAGRVRLWRRDLQGSCLRLFC